MRKLKLETHRVVLLDIMENLEVPLTFNIAADGSEVKEVEAFIAGEGELLVPVVAADIETVSFSRKKRNPLIPHRTC